jgi:hypothetical protein
MITNAEAGSFIGRGGSSSNNEPVLSTTVSGTFMSFSPLAKPPDKSSDEIAYPSQQLSNGASYPSQQLNHVRSGQDDEEKLPTLPTISNAGSKTAPSPSPPPPLPPVSSMVYEYPDPFVAKMRNPSVSTPQWANQGNTVVDERSSGSANNYKHLDSFTIGLSSPARNSYAAASLLSLSGGGHNATIEGRVRTKYTRTSATNPNHPRARTSATNPNHPRARTSATNPNHPRARTSATNPNHPRATNPRALPMRKGKVNKATTSAGTGIEAPGKLDILKGRGGLTNHHPGNVKFRNEARKLRSEYKHADTTRHQKYLFSLDLVNKVKAYGGRFLERGKDDLWYEMDEKAARKKASQGKFASNKNMFRFTS